MPRDETENYAGRDTLRRILPFLSFNEISRMQRLPVSLELPPIPGIAVGHMRLVDFLTAISEPPQSAIATRGEI